MKHRSIGLVALFVCAGVAGDCLRAQEQPRLSDQEITKRLIGEWVAEEEGAQGLKIRAVTRYAADGKLSGEAVISKGEKSVKINAEGQWKIENGFLIETVEKSNAPFIKPGQVTKDEILSINDTMYTYKTEQGKTKTARRMKAAKKD